MLKDRQIKDTPQQEKRVRFNIQQEQGEYKDREEKREYVKNKMVEALQNEEFCEKVTKAVEEVRRSRAAKEDEEIGTFTNKGRNKREDKSEKSANVAQTVKANWWKYRPDNDVY